MNVKQCARKCLVPSCKNKGNRPGLQYFSLTSRRRSVWLTAMGRDPLKGVYSESNYVCSEHFSLEDYKIKYNGKHLKKTAVPSLNMPPPGLLFDEDNIMSYSRKSIPKVKKVTKQYSDLDENCKEMLTVKVEPGLCLNVTYEDKNSELNMSMTAPEDYSKPEKISVVMLEPELCKNISYEDQNIELNMPIATPESNSKPEEISTVKLEPKLSYEDQDVDKEQALLSPNKSEQMDTSELSHGIESVFIKKEPIDPYSDSEDNAKTSCMADALLDQQAYDVKPFLPNKDADFHFHSLDTKIVSAPEKFVCNVCGGLFKTKKTLKRHSLLHTDPLNVEWFSCQHCVYKTTNKFSMDHLKLHEKEGDYKCERCGYETKFEQHLRKHMKMRHEIILGKINKCPHCPYVTRHPLSLHLRIHMDETELKIYKCTQCSFQSKYKQSLENHMIMHSDLSTAPSYKCSECNYETKIKKYLNKHKSWAHKEQKDIPQIKCELCPYVARNQSIMNLHLLRHAKPEEVNMFKCALCPYENKFKKNLKNHLITHKKLEQRTIHKCPHCNYEADQKRFLNRHVAWFHQNADSTIKMTLFKCTECPFDTNRKTNLKKHMIRMHDVTDFPEEFESHEATNDVKKEPSSDNDLEYN